MPVPAVREKIDFALKKAPSIIKNLRVSSHLRDLRHGAARLVREVAGEIGPVLYLP
jgi:hypothetical protein